MANRNLDLAPSQGSTSGAPGVNPAVLARLAAARPLSAPKASGRGGSAVGKLAQVLAQRGSRGNNRMSFLP